jgi:HPt (histidine-containing phosphotransfer) domain-containing protein
VTTELLARYGRRFVQSARERLAAANALDGDGDGALDAARALALHLHSISGEAAMIGLPELSQAARAAMRTARAVDGGGGTANECATEVARLLRMLDDLEGTLPPAR